MRTAQGGPGITRHDLVCLSVTEAATPTVSPDGRATPRPLGTDPVVPVQFDSPWGSTDNGVYLFGNIIVVDASLQTNKQTDKQTNKQMNERKNERTYK